MDACTDVDVDPHERHWITAALDGLVPNCEHGHIKSLYAGWDQEENEAFMDEHHTVLGLELDLELGLELDLELGLGLGLGLGLEL